MITSTKPYDINDSKERSKMSISSVINLIESSCTKVKVQRMWNDWRVAEIDYERIRNIQWDRLSGGINVPAPQYFIHAYIWCDDYEGELAHSCQHGKGQHNIKICITKTINEPSVLAKIENEAGTKPRYVKQSSVGDSIQ